MSKQKLLSNLLVTLLVISVASVMPKVLAATVIRPIADVTKLGDPFLKLDVTGSTFKVAIVVEGVTGLYGLDVQLRWSAEWIRYVSHVTTIPAEDYPYPQPPSTYGGALHSPIIEVKDIVNEAGGFMDADPATMGWFAYASIAPASAQDGNLVIAVFTFMVYDQPLDYQSPTIVAIRFVATSLSNSQGNEISHVAQDLQIPLHKRSTSGEYPPCPKLVVAPALTRDIAAGGSFPVDVLVMGADDGYLRPFWDVGGFDIMMHFNASLVQADSVSIDPDGWFAAFWPGGILEVVRSFDNVNGTVQAAFLGIPGEVGVHTPPYGIGRLFSVIFHSIHESRTYPPPSCVIGLRNPGQGPMPYLPPEPPTYWGPEYFMTVVAGFPHPATLMSPWCGQEESPPLPHVIQNATYTAKFRPLGRAIDMYTRDSTSFEGTGPGVPSDVFTPQATVRLYANVSYSSNPVQQKDVTFEIYSPTGEWHLMLCNRTDANGQAWVQFGLPWPCDDPEHRVFGTWNATASVDIMGIDVSDNTTWQVDYLIDFIRVEPLKPSFGIGEHLSFTITFASVSHREHKAWFSSVVYDELQVPIASFLVGPVTVHYGLNDPVVLECKDVPLHTFIGVGHVFTNILYRDPISNVFLQYCPQNVIAIGETTQVGYLIDIVQVESSKPSYAIGEHVSFNVTIASITKDRIAYISLVICDELEVPIIWFFVGPITVHYGLNGPITIGCQIVPKHTFVGVCHVYTNVLYMDPVTLETVQYCPQNVTTIILTI